MPNELFTSTRITRPLTLLFCFMLAVLSACRTEPQASITSLTFGNNAAAEPATTDFEVNTNIFVVATAANAAGKHSMNFQVSAVRDVANKTDGQPVMNKQFEFEGQQPLFMSFQLAYPGRYKVEAMLSDAKGAMLDVRSGEISVTGDPPKFEDESEEERERYEEKEKDGDKDRKTEKEREREREHERERGRK